MPTLGGYCQSGLARSFHNVLAHIDVSPGDTLLSFIFDNNRFLNSGILYFGSRIPIIADRCSSYRFTTSGGWEEKQRNVREHVKVREFGGGLAANL